MQLFLASITLVGTIVSTKMSLAVFQTADQGRPVDPIVYAIEPTSSPLDDMPYAQHADWSATANTLTYEPAPTVAVEEGQTVQGWVVDRIEPAVVFVHRGKLKCRLAVGDSPSDDVAVRHRVEVERHGDEVVLSSTLRDNISGGAGLLHVLMDAAATPVPGGYLISDIEPGSIFDRVGLKDGDVATDIDGTPLTDPWTAVQALRRVAAQDSFTVAIRTKGVARIVTVKVR